MKKSVRPNVFDYEDYREFLENWYNWMKETNESFSYRAFSKWASLKAPNHLKLIILGERNITVNLMPAFLRILKLKKKEQKYFELLVHFNQARDAVAKAKYLLEISEFHRKHGANLKANQYDYLTKWYMPAIRELVATYDFRNNTKWISKRIGHGITSKQVRLAIEKLLELGLIKRNNNGRLEQSDNIVTTGNETLESVAYLYHRNMLEMAKNALDHQKPEKRNFAGITISCAKEDIPELANMIYEFRQKILRYLDNKPKSIPNNVVYQLGIQLFDLMEGDKNNEA